METRSNHVLVGAVVLVLLAARASPSSSGSAGFGGNQEKEYDIFFSQAVEGSPRAAR